MSPRLARAGPVAAFGGALAVYGATLSPSLAPGHDSGELTAAAATLGIAHPPGYPLYTLLGHLWVRLMPFGDAAFRVNLLSAFFGAAAAGTAAAAFGCLARSPAAAFAAALCWALALTPWRLAVKAEVFSLHLFFLAALLGCAAFWREAGESGRRRAWLAGGLVLGLGLAHHQSLLFALPALALFGVLGRGGRPAGFHPGALGAVAAGLLFYLYLPLRALQDPPLNWGDPSTPERFLAVVLRRGYGTLSLSTRAGGWEGALHHLQAYFVSLALHQFPFPLFLLVAAGAVLALRRDPAAGALLGGVWLLFGPLWAVLTAQPPGEGFADMQERFYASSYLGAAGLLAFALAPLERWRGRLARWLWILALFPLTLHYPQADLSRQFYATEAMEAMYAAVPRGAVLVLGSDLTAGSALYFRHVEGRRPDLDLVFPGLLGSPWYRAQLPPDLQEAARKAADLAGFLEALRVAGREVYVDHIPPPARGFFVPMGLVFRYLAPGEPLPDRAAISRQVLRRLEAQPRRGSYRLSPDQPFWVRFLIRSWSYHYRVAGEGLLPTRPDLAVQALERALQMEPGQPGIRKLLAEARRRAGD